jgi:predicted deacylase
MMQVAGVTVAPGTKRRHAIELVELADGTRISLPVFLLNGATAGSRLYLGAAIHGDEVNGVAILARVLAELDPATLAGSIVAVLVQNPLAFHADHRLALSHYLKSPLDQAPADPWMCFPGNPEGSLAEKIADILFGLIRNCDAAIDCHTPTRGGRYVPITILPHPGMGDASRRAEELAVAFGSGYLVKTDKGMYVRDGILCVEATRAGVPAFTFEIGEGGRLEPGMVDVGVRCVRNALHHLKMLPGEPQRPVRTVRIREFVGLRATRGGLLTTEVELGAPVRRGDVLARIRSIYGDDLETFTSPVDGLYVRSTTLSAVAAGERVATVGVPE